MGVLVFLGVQNRGPKIVKNGPRVWAFCKIEFPGIQKPVQFFGQKMSFFEKCGNRGVGVIWLVRGVFLFIYVWVVLLLDWFCCGVVGVGVVLCVFGLFVVFLF